MTASRRTFLGMSATLPFLGKGAANQATVLDSLPRHMITPEGPLLKDPFGKGVTAQATALSPSNPYNSPEYQAVQEEESLLHYRQAMRNALKCGGFDADLLALRSISPSYRIQLQIARDLDVYREERRLRDLKQKIWDQLTNILK